MLEGRRQIFTHEREITRENLIKVLRQAVLDFLPNAGDCTLLLNYEKGRQEKIRVKKYRSDIDFWCVDNIANEIAQFKVDFNWGNPITLIQRGEKDSGGSDEARAIAILNEYYDAEEIKKKTQELARFVEICGIGYTIVDINSEWEDGDSPFTVNVLDPRYAFVVRSSYYPDHRIMLGVTFREDSLGNKYFTCYTRNEQFEVLNTVKIINEKTGRENKADRWNETDRSGEENPLHRIPIVEWIRDYDRMGCFERQIPEMNNLNLLISDFTNDVDQNTQAVWHANDVDFPTEIIKKEDGTEEEKPRKPKDGEWLDTETTIDGKTPFIKPLVINYDYAGMLNQIIFRTNRIKEKCNVPQRNDNSGGSTGIAMSDATGWTHAEIEANRQDQIKDGCKMEEVKCVLAAIRETALAKVDDKVLKLRHMDIKPSIKRQKNYEMVTKINTYATGVSHGLAPEHMVAAINFFDDPQQVAEDSKPYTERYLASIFDKSNQSSGDTEDKPNEDRLQGDNSDQISNSPNLDGMKTEKPEGEGKSE